jgi:hypothetical protein
VQYSKNSAWKQEFEYIWSALASFFKIQTDLRGSTHVHIKQLPRSPEEKLSTSLTFAKALAKFVVFWDPCLYILAPQRRKERAHCISNLRGSKRLFELMKEGHEKGLTYQYIFDIIDNYKLPQNELLDDANHPDDLKRKQALAMLMCGSERNVAWSFHYLWSDKVDGVTMNASELASGTLENRRGQGSRTLVEARAQSALTMCFAYGAVFHMMHNSQLYKDMCGAKIAYTTGVWQSVYNNNPLLYQECVDFGTAHLEQFQEWMKKVAKDMQLEDNLNVEKSNE